MFIKSTLNILYLRAVGTIQQILNRNTLQNTLFFPLVKTVLLQQSCKRVFSSYSTSQNSLGTSLSFLNYPVRQTLQGHLQSPEKVSFFSSPENVSQTKPSQFWNFHTGSERTVYSLIVVPFSLARLLFLAIGNQSSIYVLSLPARVQFLSLDFYYYPSNSTCLCSQLLLTHAVFN